MADRGDKILNPATGRWVSKKGRIGKAILAAADDAKMRKRFEGNQFSRFIESLHDEKDRAFALSLGQHIPLIEFIGMVHKFQDEARRVADEARRTAYKEKRRFIDSLPSEEKRAMDQFDFLASMPLTLDEIKAKLSERRREEAERRREEEHRRREEQSRRSMLKLKEQMREAKLELDRASERANPRFKYDEEHDTDNFYGQ